MDDNTNTPTQIQVIPNGPLRITGKLVVTKPDGTIVEKDVATFCRCGASANKPFCDGGHKALGFQG